MLTSIQGISIDVHFRLRSVCGNFDLMMHQQTTYTEIYFSIQKKSIYPFCSIFVDHAVDLEGKRIDKIIIKKLNFQLMKSFYQDLKIKTFFKNLGFLFYNLEKFYSTNIIF